MPAHLNFSREVLWKQMAAGLGSTSAAGQAGPRKTRLCARCKDILEGLNSTQILTPKLLPSVNCCSLETQSLAFLSPGVSGIWSSTEVIQVCLGLGQPEACSLQTVSAVGQSGLLTLVIINVKADLLGGNASSVEWGRPHLLMLESCCHSVGCTIENLTDLYPPGTA